MLDSDGFYFFPFSPKFNLLIKQKSINKSHHKPKKEIENKIIILKIKLIMM
jgi:hypothetical protein